MHLPTTMMRKVSLVLSAIVLACFAGTLAAAQSEPVIDLNAKPASTGVDIAPVPKTATLIVGSLFDVPIFINTRGKNINTIELYLDFDPGKLNVVRPSGDKSIIKVWLEPPTYSNINGTLKFTGIITNGVTTESGLIASITFKAIRAGDAVVSVDKRTRVLLNDGLGTEVPVNLDRGVYTILPQPPGAIRVFSETHPYQDTWYNNMSPILAWDKEPGVTDFSYVLDNKPFTIPLSNSLSEDATKAYDNVGDGLWYFYLKGRKNKAWSTTTHFLIRIDTAPPLKFVPLIDYLTASVITRALVSFSTVDILSGIDHYEVGILEKNKSAVESPVFIQAESPYQLPVNLSGNIRVVVRAFDRAGNVTDNSIDLVGLKTIAELLKNNIALVLLALLLFLVLIHYLFGHHIIAQARKVWRFLKQEKEKENKENSDH